MFFHSIFRESLMQTPVFMVSTCGTSLLTNVLRNMPDNELGRACRVLY